MLMVITLLTLEEAFSIFKNFMRRLVLAAGAATISVLVAVEIFEKSSPGVIVVPDRSIHAAYAPIFPAEPVTS